MYSSLPSTVLKYMLLMPMVRYLAPGEEIVLFQCSLVVSSPAVPVLVASPAHGWAGWLISKNLNHEPFVKSINQ